MVKEIQRASEELVDWRPQWTGEELEHYNRMKAALEPRISLVKALRDRLGLSQKEVAELLETTQSNVSKIEAKSDPSLSVLRRMVEGRGGKLKLVLEMADGEPFEIAA
jgi:DNA-directed RNA polymerase specialized sigma subunit